MKSKLIRNLKVGDWVEVIDAVHYPHKVYRVMIVHVQETRRSITGKRMWQASFLPHLRHGSWCNITGYSTDRVDVFKGEN